MKTKLLFPLLFVSVNAFSQINTFPINQTIIGPGTLSFDLNNDGDNDFSFEIITLSPDVFAARVLTIGASTILDNSTFGYPDALDEGDSVSGNFETGNGVLGTINNAGQFKGAGDKYLGIKIAGSGNEYLGWIKLNCNVNRDTLNIISCGYNTVASAAIKAGQTATTSINEIEVKQAVTIYPNPFSTQAILQIENDFHDATLWVENCSGETVKQIEHVKGKSIVLTRDNLAAGVYFVRVIEDEELLATKKIIIID